MVDLNLKLPKNGVTHLRDNGVVRFYLSARVLSHKDVSFSFIFLNVLEGINSFTCQCGS